MVTVNVIGRVFQIRYGFGTGTCFSVDHNGKQYFVTAKHVVNMLSDSDNVELFYKDTWYTFPVKLVGHHPVADISVFSLEVLIPAHPMPATSEGLVYGQDVYFLGFPYNLRNTYHTEINRNFPFPLIKKAIVSALFMEGNDKYLLLDGINNPGFSGGPVIFKDVRSKKDKVVAVISGYRIEEEPQNPGLLTNTGIIIAHNICNAIELIEQNPIGVSLA